MELKVQSKPSNLPKLSVNRQPVNQPKISVQPPAAVQKTLSVMPSNDQSQRISSVGTATEQRASTPKMDIRQFGQTIKQKFPQYANIDDEELGRKTLEKYPEYSDRVSTPVQTQQQPEQDRSGGFFSRLGGDIKQRVSNLRESSQLVDEGKQGNLGFGFQTAGQVAGLVGDVAMEGLTSAWRTLAPKSMQEGFAQRGEDIGRSGVVQDLAQRYQGFKERSPVGAKNLEAGLNIGSLIPVTRGAKVVAAPVGQAAGKAATQVEKQIAKKALDEALILIEPQMTKKTTTSALKKGLGKITATGKLALEASPADRRIADAIKDVVDISKSIPDNITSLRSEIAEISDRVVQGLQQTPAIFNKNQMKSFLDKTKESSRVIFGSDATLNSQYDAVIDLYMEQLAKQKNNLGGALEARKQFDNIIEQKFPNLYNNPASDVVRVNAIKDVRRSVNDFIANKLPEGNTFKADLKKQSEMFTAIDRLAAKQFAVANREVLDQVSNIFKRHPIATAAGLVGIGTTVSLSNPIVLASILLYGGYKVGRKVLTMRHLAKALRMIEKTLNPKDKQAIEGLLRAMRNSVGLTTEDVSGRGFQNFSDLSLKTLGRLEGKTTVSKQFIQDLTKMGDIKQVERDLINDALKNYGDTVNVQQFAENVKQQLLPLSAKEVSPRYEGVNLDKGQRGPILEYRETIYESPIETQAGYVHFNQNRDAMSKNYFAHARTEDLPPSSAQKEVIDGVARNRSLFTDDQVNEAMRLEKGDTRRIVEIQSDLFQKGRLESEALQYKASPIEGTENELVSGRFGRTKVQPAGKRENDLKMLSPYRNLWQERLIKEEVKKAALDGKKKLQFPTGETAMKIEGLGSVTSFHETFMNGRRAVDPNNLKIGQEIFHAGGNNALIITEVLGNGKFRAVPKRIYDNIADKRLANSDFYSETFDISGKIDMTNPIYRFYEKEVGRYLKNKYNAKLVTDDQGVTWWEIDIKDDYGKLPIEAYAAAPLTLGAISERNKE